MSLTVLGVLHIHGPTLLLTLSKAVLGFNIHQSHISGTKFRATSLKVENSSSMCLQPEHKQAEKDRATFTDLKIKQLRLCNHTTSCISIPAWLLHTYTSRMMDDY